MVPLDLIGGLGLLLAGGYVLVRGASGLATSFGVSQMIIGLTVVAFGTSAPELAVNILASTKGSDGMAFGNVVGSNLANIGLILGLSALLKPLVIKGKIVGREIPLMLLATVSVVVLGLNAQLDLRGDVYERTDGIMLLLVFSVFLYTAIGDVFRQRSSDALLRQAEDQVDEEPTAPQALRRVFYAVLTLGGLTALVIGGDLCVEGASTIARDLGLSEAVIGLTVVAIGTSLPELVTSVIAALRGQTDIAIGNVIGSNIFNLLLVLGTTSTITPVRVPEGGMEDLLVLTVVSAVIIPMALTNGGKIHRWKGALLLAAWLGHMAYRVTLVH